MTTPAGTAELRELVLPALANHHGTLFAGQGLQLMAKAAFLAARSLAQREVVMAAVTGIDFLAPVPVGHEIVLRGWVSRVGRSSIDRKSTRLNSSHLVISYAVFCLKKKMPVLTTC